MFNNKRKEIMRKEIINSRSRLVDSKAYTEDLSRYRDIPKHCL